MSEILLQFDSGGPIFGARFPVALQSNPDVSCYSLAMKKVKIFLLNLYMLQLYTHVNIHMYICSLWPYPSPKNLKRKAEYANKALHLRKIYAADKVDWTQEPVGKQEPLRETKRSSNRVQGYRSVSCKSETRSEPCIRTTALLHTGKKTSRKRN